MTFAAIVVSPVPVVSEASAKVPPTAPVSSVSPVPVRVKARAVAEEELSVPPTETVPAPAATVAAPLSTALPATDISLLLVVSVAAATVILPP